MRIIQTDPDKGKHLVEISTEEAIALHSVLEESNYIKQWKMLTHMTDKLNRIIP